MAKWQGFGNQVNHLVYVLATKNHKANISVANRYIAEKTSYSEDSIRMMRQGKFLPADESTLEILIEIGKNEASLGKDWAESLLQGTRSSNSNKLLNKYFPSEILSSSTFPAPQIKPSFVSRIAGAAIGCLFTLFLWTYMIQPTYPAPHELAVLQECLWGLLIGVGCAAGIAIADTNLSKLIFQNAQLQLGYYLLLPAGGVLGAFLWKLFSGIVIFQMQGKFISSTRWETFWFGFWYGLAFSIPFILFRKKDYFYFYKLKPFTVFMIICSSCAFLSLAGYFLAAMQPSFANQKDIDIFVGLLLRMALILNLAIFFPIPVNPKPLIKIES